MGDLRLPCDVGEVSDGYHTFNELYGHRCYLFAALMMCNHTISWRARKNSDGSEWEGWFVVGMTLPSGPVSYHLPSHMWGMFDKMYGHIRLEGRINGDGVPSGTFEVAPPWDGHTSADVVERLRKWIEL